MGSKYSFFDVIVVGGGPAGATSALKCSELGLKVLLVERKDENRYKPCGGLLSPACLNVISYTLKETISYDALSSPTALELYCVPPNGKENGGVVKSFKLLNIKRNVFDNWLAQLALKSGVKILYEAEFIRFLNKGFTLQVLIKHKGKTMRTTTKYLVGADGVYSRVRKLLYSEAKINMRLILQEYWKADLNFGDYFYILFQRDLIPSYFYIIPKNGIYILGVGAPRENYSISVLRSYIDKLKERLCKEFAFKPHRMIKSEVWAIPHGFFLEGVGSTILVGDAAGFCNPLTGEGIRFAIESGVAASKAIQDAMICNVPLAAKYREKVEHISRFVYKTQQLLSRLTYKDLEYLIEFELAR
ncbi:MAG: NAD(P)/FAD-dependent oxidoreductase [Candidatus Bathyarchaeia archaeon]